MTTERDILKNLKDPFDILEEHEVTLIDSMGSDLAVVDAARVSFNKESELDPETNLLKAGDQKLIKYLADHNHWTPFAHTSLKFRVKTSFAMARQLVKHQVGLVWNEVSRRYVSDPPKFYMPDEWRGKPVNAKQGSSDVILTQLLPYPADIEDSDGESIDYAVYQYLADGWALYNRLIDSGVCAEQARFVLPLAGMTEWIWTGSLVAFARVVNLRKDSHAQKEVQDVVSRIDALIPPQFKHSWAALTGKA